MLLPLSLLAMVTAGAEPLLLTASPLCMLRQFVGYPAGEGAWPVLVLQHNAATTQGWHAFILQRA